MLNSPTVTSTRKILVADDDPICMLLLSRALKHPAHRITSVRDGQQAVDSVLRPSDPQGIFDVICLDLQMPRLSGLEAAMELRSVGVTTPLIAMTACTENGEAELCRDAGFNALLSKPISKDELLGILDQLCPIAAQDTEAAKPSRNAASEYVDSTQDPSFAPLAARFRQNLGTQQAAIDTALKNGDRQALTTIAHRLNGTATNYGYPEITLAAANCEADLISGKSLALIQPSLNALLSAISAVIS